MSIITRNISSPELAGARLLNRSWLGVEMRVSAIEMGGFVWDSALLPRPSGEGRAYVVLPLEGSVRLLARGVRVSPGEGVVFPSFAASFDERVVIFPRHRAIALRVERARARFEPPFGVFPVDVDIALRLHSVLWAAGSHVPEAALADSLTELVRMLATAGVLDPLTLTTDGADEPADEPVARALTRALTLGDPRPTLTLIEDSLALSERHARRRVDSFLIRHRMPFSRWRDLRQSFSLTGAGLALSLPGISTETVSRAAGFASATGLCHAFQRAGLPPPQEIARAHARLREELGDGDHARAE